MSMKVLTITPGGVDIVQPPPPPPPPPRLTWISCRDAFMHLFATTKADQSIIMCKPKNSNELEKWRMGE